MNQNINNGRAGETWQPLPNVAPDSLKNKILFGLRLFFDLNVFTVYKSIKKQLKDINGNVLEIGCGLQPYRHLIPKETSYYALEWKGSRDSFHYVIKNDVIYYNNGGVFPFRNEDFGFVFHTEVLEHIYDLRQFLSECYRVLAKNGKMFFTVPFAARHHYIPNDYWRLTPASIEKLLKELDFKNISIKNRGTDIVVAFSKLTTICYRIILKQYENLILKTINMIFWGSLFFIPIICLTISCHLLLLLKIGSPDDPLGYAVRCEK